MVIMGLLLLAEAPCRCRGTPNEDSEGMDDIEAESDDDSNDPAPGDPDSRPWRCRGLTVGCGPEGSQGPWDQWPLSL